MFSFECPPLVAQNEYLIKVVSTSSQKVRYSSLQKRTFMLRFERRVNIYTYMLKRKLIKDLRSVSEKVELLNPKLILFRHRKIKIRLFNRK